MQMDILVMTSMNVPRIHAVRTAPRMDQVSDINVAVGQERNWMWIRGLALTVTRVNTASTANRIVAAMHRTLSLVTTWMAVVLVRLAGKEPLVQITSTSV